MLNYSVVWLEKPMTLAAGCCRERRGGENMNFYTAALIPFVLLSIITLAKLRGKDWPTGLLILVGVNCFVLSVIAATGQHPQPDWVAQWFTSRLLENTKVATIIWSASSVLNLIVAIGCYRANQRDKQRAISAKHDGDSITSINFGGQTFHPYRGPRHRDK